MIQPATGGCGQVHPGAALGGNGVEPVIALKHVKIFSFCIIPAGADWVPAIICIFMFVVRNKAIAY